MRDHRVLVAVLIAFCLALLVMPGWAAYYVINSPNYSGTKVCYRNGGWPDATCATGTDNTTIQAAVTAAGVGGEVIISGGSYVAAQLDASGGVDTSANNQTIRGATAADGMAYSGRVTLDGTSCGGNTLRTNLYSGAVVKNLKLISAAGFWGLYAGAGTFEDIEVTGAGKGVSLVNGANAYRLYIHNVAPSGQEYAIQSSVGTNTLNSSIIETFYTPVYLSGSAVLTVNNSIFTGSGSNAYTGSTVLTATTFSGSGTFNNCIFPANSTRGFYSTYIINNPSTSGGTLSINNSDIVRNVRSGNSTNGVTLNNVQYVSPKFKSPLRGGKISFSVDDVANYTVFATMADYLRIPGITLFAQYSPAVIDATYPSFFGTIESYIAKGFEVGGHTFGHASLTNLNAIAVSSTQTTPTVEIVTSQTDSNPANWTGTIVLKEGGVSINGSGWDLTGALYKDLAGLATRINAQTGWAATVNAQASGACASVTLKTTTQNVASGYTFTFENSLTGSTPVERWWYYEVVYHKKLLEERLSADLGYPYVLKSFAYPGGAFNTTLAAWMANQANFTPLGVTKYIGARQADASSAGSWTLSSDYTSGDGALAGLQTYEILGPHMSVNVGTSNVAELGAAWGEWANYEPCFFVFYSHAFTEYTEANLKLFVDGILSVPGLSIKTMGQHLTDITTSGEWTDIGGNGSRWTRTYTNSPNYHLMDSSPFKSAGANVGLATDFSGRAFKNPTPSMGAYQFFPVQQNGGLSGDLSLGLGL